MVQQVGVGGTIEVAEINFGDNDKLPFGDADDAGIVYDGTNFILTPADVGTGNLKLQGGQLHLDATEILYLDGGGDTYIQEVSANRPVMHSGSQRCYYGTNSASKGLLVIYAPDAALADAGLEAGTCVLYLNEAGNTLTVKAKYADGTTVKTGTIALT